MAKKLKSEKDLPTGIDRLDSGTLRVRIRVRGMDDAVRTFPLHEVSRTARERQLHEATAWQAQTAAKMKSGMHVSTKEAESLRLRDALEKLRGEGLKDRNENSRKNAVILINVLLRDPIADRPLAQISAPDVAALRDRLISQGWLKSVDNAIKRLSKEKPSAEIQRRLDELNSLPVLRKKAEAASGAEQVSLRMQVEEIATRERVTDPVRTTITNKTNLINVALRHMGESVHGVAPPVRNVRMPSQAPSRTRRPTGDEWERLLAAAATIDPLCPLVLRFAVLTALRRDRCLTVRMSNLIDIAAGKQVIRFARDKGAKKTGNIPVTTEIRTIINQALELRKDASNDRLIFAVPVETFEKWFEKAIRAADIHDLHFHDLRHEATSRLFEQGLNMMEVMSITGHTTTEMVERYSHYSSGLILDKLEAASKRTPESILKDIKAMVARYLEAGGDADDIKNALFQ